MALGHKVREGGVFRYVFQSLERAGERPDFVEAPPFAESGHAGFRLQDRPYPFHEKFFQFLRRK